MKYRGVILMIGVAFVIINFKDVVLDCNLFDFPKSGQLRLPNLFAFLLGLFIIIFCAWSWYSNRKKHEKYNKNRTEVIIQKNEQ